MDPKKITRLIEEMEEHRHSREALEAARELVGRDDEELIAAGADIGELIARLDEEEYFEEYRNLSDEEKDSMSRGLFGDRP